MKSPHRAFFPLLVLAAALFAARSEAITPQQLVEPFFNDEPHVTVAVRNLPALFGSVQTPFDEIFSRLIAPAVDLTEGGKAFLDRMGCNCEAVMRFPCDSETRQGVMAMELLPDIHRDASFLALFSRDAPPSDDGMTHLMRYRCGESNIIYLAYLARGGQGFLAAALNDPALLDKMASEPLRDTARLRHLDDSFWLEIPLPPSKLSEIFQRDFLPDFMSEPLTLELGISGTERSLRARLWLDVKSGTPLKDTPPAPPFITGSGNLLGLISMESPLDFSAAVQKLYDDNLAGSSQSTGLLPEDLLEALLGRVTFGIAGKSSTILGHLPGIYLHIAGANERFSDILMRFAAGFAVEQDIKTEPFSAGIWKGIRTQPWSLASGYAAVGDGFILALQDSSELGRTPAVSPALQSTLDARVPLTIALDTPALISELKQLTYAYGGALLNESQRKEASVFFAAAEMFGAFTLTSDTDIMKAELFINRPKFSAFIDEVASGLTPKASAPSAVTSDSAPSADKEDSQDALPRLRQKAFEQIKVIFPRATQDGETGVISADYDGKHVTLEVSAENGGTLRISSETDNSKLGLGAERAGRLLRSWQAGNSRCSSTTVRFESSLEITLYKTIPYTLKTTDVQLIQETDAFLEALDSFYDLAKQ